MKRTILFLIFFTSSSVLLAANEADLWLVKTQGVWKQANDWGYYQVRVYREGSEHSKDRVEVWQTQILNDTGVAKIKNKIALPGPGIKGYVKDIEFSKIDEQHMLVILNIEMKAMNEITLKEVYRVYADGKVKLLKSAEYFDVLP